MKCTQPGKFFYLFFLPFYPMIKILSSFWKFHSLRSWREKQKKVLIGTSFYRVFVEGATYATKSRKRFNLKNENVYSFICERG